MIILTGANTNFYLSLRQLLNNLKYFVRKVDKVFVVDLGLTSKQFNFLKSRNYNQWYNVEFIQIPLNVVNKYPNHVKDLQTYAFKAMIFDYLILKNDIKDRILWIDSANLIHNTTLEIEIMISQAKIYSPYSAEDIQTYCHPLTIKRLMYTGSLKNDMLSGGCIGIDTTTNLGLCFLKDFCSSCFNKDIIVPEGSNKSNHRQDQSVLTILYWNYYKNYTLHRIKEWKHISFHNNIWLHEI
tara:strand:- start:487 stop:1206 length:720 start_codon:yes stop_codon:yes gene_type:complete